MLRTFEYWQFRNEETYRGGNEINKLSDIFQII